MKFLDFFSEFFELVRGMRVALRYLKSIFQDVQQVTRLLAGGPIFRIIWGPPYYPMLLNLPYYQPTDETLKKRKELTIFKPKSGLREYTVDDLRKHNGCNEESPILTGLAGYVFQFKPYFKIYWGRDGTGRILLHYPGIIRLVTNGPQLIFFCRHSSKLRIPTGF